MDQGGKTMDFVRKSILGPGILLWLKAALLVCVACLTASVAVFPQGIATGSVSGTVTDPAGASLPGAHVTALNTATNQESSGDTNDSGVVTFRSLPPGIYKITITSKSFRTTVLDNIEVSVSK